MSKRIVIALGGNALGNTAAQQLELVSLTAKPIVDLIAAGKLDTTPLITHTYPLWDIAAAYDLFEQHGDGVIKVAIDMAL